MRLQIDELCMCCRYGARLKFGSLPKHSISVKFLQPKKFCQQSECRVHSTSHTKVVECTLWVCAKGFEMTVNKWTFVMVRYGRCVRFRKRLTSLIRKFIKLAVKTNSVHVCKWCTRRTVIVGVSRKCTLLDQQKSKSQHARVFSVSLEVN